MEFHASNQTLGKFSDIGANQGPKSRKKKNSHPEYTSMLLEWITGPSKIEGKTWVTIEKTLNLK